MIDNLLGGIPSKILGFIDNLFGGIPGKIVKFVWNGLQTVFGKLIDFLGDAIGGLIRGIGNIVSGFKETDEQADARIAKEGHSVTHGVGRVGGGIWDTITGGSEGFFSLSGRWKGLKKTFWGAWETIAGVGEGIWNGAKSAWNTVSGWASSAWGAVTDFFGNIKDTVGGWISNIGGFLGSCWDSVSGFFGSVTDTVSGWVSSAGSFLGSCWDSVSGFFSSVTDTVSGWVSDAGSFLGSCWDSVTGFFGGVGDFFSGAAEGIGSLASSAWDTASGFISSAIEGVGSFLEDPIGSVGSAVSSIGSAIGDGLSSVGSAIAESPLNPLNWFEEGTREVDKGGLAVLHPGEMIIPKNVWDSIKAIGTGAFGGGGEEKGVFGSIFEGIGNLFGGGGGISDMLSSAFGSIGSIFGIASPINAGAFEKGETKTALEGAMDSTMKMAGVGEGGADLADQDGLQVHDDSLETTLKEVFNSLQKQSEVQHGESTTTLMGAFDSGAGREAAGSSIWSNLSNMTNMLDMFTGGTASSVMDMFTGGNTGGSSIVSSLGGAISNLFGGRGEASQQGAGLFDAASNIFEAMTQSVASFVASTVDTNDLNNIVSTALETKKSQAKQQILAEVSRSLDYESTASDTAVKTKSSEMGLATGEITTSPLDYTDDLRGEVSTSTVSRAAVESVLERERAGVAAAGGSTIMPSMDEIADYLMTAQSEKLDAMIELLTSIRDNTGQRSMLSNIIGALGAGVPPSTRPGVKSIARDTTRGYWDLAFPDASPGTVNTEGRGGEA